MKQAAILLAVVLLISLIINVFLFINSGKEEVTIIQPQVGELSQASLPNEVEAIRQQTNMEFSLIRSIATQESADQTVATIDALLEGREGRLDETIKKLREDREALSRPTQLPDEKERTRLLEQRRAMQKEKLQKIQEMQEANSVPAK